VEEGPKGPLAVRVSKL